MRNNRTWTRSKRYSLLSGVSATLLVAAAFTAAPLNQAQALSECSGGIDPGTYTTVTCSPGTYSSIIYRTESGVELVADAGVIVDAVATDGINLARNLTISNNNIPRNEYAGTWSFIADNGLTLRVDGTGATAPVVGISAIGNSGSIKLTNADIDVNANWGVALHTGSYDGQAYIEMNNSRIVLGGNVSRPAVLAVAYHEGDAIIQMNGGEVINNNTTQYNSVGLEAKTHGQGAAIVRMTAGTITLSGGIGIMSWNANDDSSISQGEGTGDIIIDTSEGTIINAGARGMYATGDLVDVTSRSNITSNEGIVAGGGQYGGTINVRQTAGFIEAGYIGIYAITFLSGNPVTVSNDARITVSNSGTSSSLSYGMAALTSGTGLTTVNNTGTVETRGDYSHATYAKSDGGAVAFNLAGTVTSQGTNSIAVYGIAETSAEVKSSAAISSQNYGIYLTATGTATTADVQLTGGSVTSATTAIRIETPGDISVTNTQGTITATDVGISAEGTSAINISNKGNITVTDSASIGIAANSTTSTAEVTVTNTQATISAVDTGILATGTHTVTASNGGEINVSGTLAHGIEATSTSGNANAAVSAGGIIRMTGEDATAISINALSGTADVKVDGTVETLAKNGTGIRATAAHTDILVDTNGIITGGWEDGSSAANPSAAIVLASATSGATVTNNGQIGALSDRAIYAPDSFASATNITNNGHITGYVDLGNQQNTFTNTGSWDIRDYSDTNGDGIRERQAISVSNFGTSGNNTVTNSGTITLKGTEGGTVSAIETTGYYLPAGYSFNTMAVDGPVQGHIMGVSTFSNSGVIDLTDNAVAGDVLVISGGHTAGVSGGGVFIANGGVINLNTVLNEGGVNSQSDVLVVDSTAQGASSTMINVIPDAASAGAYTTGNGILLIEVLDNTASVAGIFMLAQPVISGAYEYTLYHNGLGTDASDGNWYLRSTAPDIIDPVDPPITVIPPVGPDPDPGVVTPIETTRPNIQPGVPVAMAMIPLATQYGYAMLDTLHERVGETYPQQPIPVFKQYYVTDKLGQRQLVKIMPRNQEREAWFRGAWARLIGERGLRDRGNFTRHGADYVYNFGGIQAGIDVYAREQSDQTLDKVGLYVGYGQIRSKVTAAYGGKAGTIDMDAYTVGGYWTHFSPNNWYTDAVVQGTWYSSDSSTVAGQRLKSDGFGLIASLEGGYTFKLKDGWAIEPQAQVVYQNVSFDKFNDGRALYDLNSGDSLRGRVGLRIKKDWNTASDQAKPRLITTWLRANVWHEFLGNSKLTVSSTQGYNPVQFSTPLSGTWGEIGAGITAQLSDNMNVFASGAYNHSLDNKGLQSWDGRLGLTLNW